MDPSAMERDDQLPGHAPGDDSHSRPASHAPAHDHTHPDGSLHEHREERVTFSPIAAPLGAATPASDTGTTPTDVTCDQSAKNIAGTRGPLAQRHESAPETTGATATLDEPRAELLHTLTKPTTADISYNPTRRNSTPRAVKSRH